MLCKYRLCSRSFRKEKLFLGNTLKRGAFFPFSLEINVYFFHSNWDCFECYFLSFHAYSGLRLPPPCPRRASNPPVPSSPPALHECPPAPSLRLRPHRDAATADLRSAHEWGGGLCRPEAAATTATTAAAASPREEAPAAATSTEAQESGTKMANSPLPPKKPIKWSKK